MVHDEMATVAIAQTPPPFSAVLPVMVHDDKVTVPPTIITPPPELELAVFPLMVHDEKVTVPPVTKTPPPPPWLA